MATMAFAFASSAKVKAIRAHQAVSSTPSRPPPTSARSRALSPLSARESVHRGHEAQFRPGGRNCHSRWVRTLPRITAVASGAGISGQGAGDEGEYEGEYVSQTAFPRLHVRDPYKLLGVSRDASEEEIREARNYLSGQYADHEKSRESIEAAYDRIIMESFRDRKKAKINLKANMKKKVAESPPWVQALTRRFEVPTSQIILQRAALFFLLGVWSVMNPAEGGPAFQVAVSLAACIYFLNDRLKSLGRAFLIGFVALIVGWLMGSFVVPVLSSYIIPPSWSLELSTALFSYIFLWVACTFLK